MSSAIPENSAPFSLAEVAKLCGGTLHGADVTTVGVSSDSRQTLGGKLFVALRGERFDGHEFARKAAEAGAGGVLIERDLGGLPIPSVRVKSTLDALGKLGQAHRKRWHGKIVAVAGSAGKTTTRSAIAAVLCSLGADAVHYAAGNLNNLIGVPMVLLGLEARHTLGLVEIGTNARGEVGTLSALSEPDLAVLTMIGVEHSEGLGELDQIEQEEGQIWHGLRATGTAIVNADDPRVLRTLSGARTSRRMSYGRATNAQYQLLERSSAVGGSRLRVERDTAYARDVIELEVPLLGEAGAYATLAAVAVAEDICQRALEPRQISEALRAAGEPGRLTPIELRDEIMLLDDSYNSNPASMTSSLDVAQELAQARRARLVLVLGEMRELGALSERMHRETARKIAELRPGLLVAVSGDARYFAQAEQEPPIETHFAEAPEGALEILLERVLARDVVLVKASRGVHAERIVEGLVRARGLAA
ncbi:MAG TPA: UDP-N-acetylmuramoyl-tripeptide--D-alanyl-D-alanine ligase [Polyangiaceae bacterium]|jgi:UDP-N-acetylmuramoyl-tripeptide--D-alanyl-D-alanine ligase